MGGEHPEAKGVDPGITLMIDGEGELVLASLAEPGQIPFDVGGFVAKTVLSDNCTAAAAPRARARFPGDESRRLSRTCPDSGGNEAGPLGRTALVHALRARAGPRHEPPALESSVEPAHVAIVRTESLAHNGIDHRAGDIQENARRALRNERECALDDEGSCRHPLPGLEHGGKGVPPGNRVEHEGARIEQEESVTGHDFEHRTEIWIGVENQDRGRSGRG